MLSSRLNAFVIPTSQTSADRSPRARRCRRPGRGCPVASTIAAAPNCAASFATGGQRARRRRRGRRRREAPQPPRIAEQLARARDRRRPRSRRRSRPRARRRCRCRRAVGVDCSRASGRPRSATSRRATGVRSSAQITRRADAARATAAAAALMPPGGAAARRITVTECCKRGVWACWRSHLERELAAMPTCDPSRVLRCPVCRGGLDETSAGFHCRGCDARVSRSRTASRACSTTGCRGSREKRAEIDGWAAMAKAQGWYEPDDAVDARPPVPLTAISAGTTTLARERALVLAPARPLRATGDAGARGRRGQGVGRPASGPARCRVCRHGHPRRLEDRARAAAPSTSSGSARSRAFRQTASTSRSRTALRPRLLRRDAPPRARPGRMVSEMARVTRRGGVVAAPERGHPRRSGERRDRRPGGGEGLRDQRARAHALGLPVGVRPRRPRRAAGRARRGLPRPGRTPDRREAQAPPLVGRSAATWLAQTCYGYSGVSLSPRGSCDPPGRRGATGPGEHRGFLFNR